MKKIRKYRLVCACINLVGNICRLIAALVDMDSNYVKLPNAISLE